MLRFVACVVVLLVTVACPSRTPVELYVDGFTPEQVTFDVEELGAVDAAGLDAVAARPDVDGQMRVPLGTCSGACRAVIVSVFVTNKGRQPEPAPVVRIEAPAGRARRLPIAFSAPSIDPGRRGRVRWLVEMWPEEQHLTATLTSSVTIDVGGSR